MEAGFGIDMFRAASYVHDAAKVIEFTERDGAITALAGYNHVIEPGRIVRELSGPEALAHMVEAHSFAGALVVPRTREAQLFMLVDALCFNVFPEQGPGVVERHLKANGWEDPRTLERYRAPRAQPVFVDTQAMVGSTGFQRGATSTLFHGALTADP